MNTPRTTAAVLGISLGLMISPSAAQAATGPDPQLTSASPAQAKIWVPPFFDRWLYCVTHTRDLMLPGEEGIAWCMEHGY